MSIEMLALCGAVVGLVIGLTLRVPVGCVTLLLVPIGMIAYIYWWQTAHPENLRSTSGLDYLFAPLWPSLGAAFGFLVGVTIRVVVFRRES
jgi:hypothetical protein